MFFRPAFTSGTHLVAFTSVRSKEVPPIANSTKFGVALMRSTILLVC